MEVKKVPDGQIDKIMAYEQGEMDQEAVVEFFQELLDTDLIKHLQGSYQRTMMALIEAGMVRLNK